MVEVPGPKGSMSLAKGSKAGAGIEAEEGTGVERARTGAAGATRLPKGNACCITAGCRGEVCTGMFQGDC